MDTTLPRYPVLEALAADAAEAEAVRELAYRALRDLAGAPPLTFDRDGMLVDCAGVRTGDMHDCRCGRGTAVTR